MIFELHFARLTQKWGSLLHNACPADKHCAKVAAKTAWSETRIRRVREGIGSFHAGRRTSIVSSTQRRQAEPVFLWEDQMGGIAPEQWENHLPRLFQPKLILRLWGRTKKVPDANFWLVPSRLQGEPNAMDQPLATKGGVPHPNHHRAGSEWLFSGLIHYMTRLQIINKSLMTVNYWIQFIDAGQNGRGPRSTSRARDGIRERAQLWRNSAGFAESSDVNQVWKIIQDSFC